MWRTGAFTVGEVFLRTRKRAQLTQAELARRLGWHSSKVCGIEQSGRIRPDELLALAGVVGIDPKSLFDEVLDALLGVPHRKRSQDTSASRQRIRLAQRYVAETLRDGLSG
jgi:transcriptional regulator with XRE-family HTH domain